MTLILRYKKIFLFIFLIIFGIRTGLYGENSVLSSGTWYKLSISSTGMYQITYSDLSSMGVDVSNIDPRNIRIFHNGGGVLPKLNKSPYPDDLTEIPIFVSGESDGVFNQGDYVLFYARGPVVWQYFSVKGYYGHVNNPYTDYTYVFLTIGEERGKRIETAEVPQTTEVVTVDDFIDAKLYDFNDVNINNMGCTWYSEAFDVTLQRNYEFSFSNINLTRDVKMRSATASKNPSTASFVYKYNNMVLYLKSFPAITGSSQTTYANYDTTCLATFTATGNPINISLTYTRASSSSIGWLDYISVNAWRYLKMVGDVMPFRNPECNDKTQIYEYKLQNATDNIRIWNVTDPTEPKMMTTSLSSSTLSFKVRGSVNNEFVAFNGNSFNKATFVGTVENQNLHAMKDVDYLIITHPKFKSHAERLKEIHADLDDLNIEIVLPQQIYNEFSCGAQDIAGIRNFIRMLYNNSEGGNALKYVLLFGDASYNYKNPDVCFIPSWESVNTWSLSSIVTDDFFVCLDDNDGIMENNTSIIDIPIGRMPVSTTEEATNVIEKIEAYIAKNNKVMGNWRNVVTFMCDDESPTYIGASEDIAKSLSSWGGDVVVDKIYLDAFNQIATASGQRCPEINEAISNRIARGSLVVNYYGHGGEIGLGDERILTINDINSWQNMPMFPLFVTATCEFSRFDDHTRTSAGEIMFTSKRGGAIAMITTARVTSGSQPLLTRTYKEMFKLTDGEYPTMGDIYLKSKQDNLFSTKVFVLFGDPALRLAYPKNNVVLTKINGKPVVPPTDTINTNDTLKALSTIELDGEIRDNFGELMEDFNGEISILIYDKENTYRTKGDNGGPIIDFQLRNSLLFNGKAIVNSGKFNIRFILPKDINYSYGKGLISFYATDYNTDANGSYENIIIGGYNDTALPDVDGPEARIFIDDTLFVSGGITNENPTFFAFVKDKNGINTTGTGIGHDITATLTGATNKIYNLNLYYDTPFDLNDYGSIVYHFYNLNEGEHHLTFKVWDIYNNSTTVSLDFTVVKSNNLIVENVFNAPNPMSSYTNFQFEHNQKGNLDITINIYNISGQLVKTIKENRYGTSTRIEPIYWDGTSDSGASLPSGIYIYNVMLTNSNNEKQSGYSKLVIAR